jgi:2-polyprenyl-3-methyl-5-hydroxy-6-metoxy-1,4-benzoquinol methylase
MKICNSRVTCEGEKIFRFEKNGYQVWDCRKCSRRFSLIENKDTHLSEVYSDNYFFAGKGGYPNYLEEKDILFKSGIQYAQIINKYTSPGKILDVGCAAGFILKGFVSFGWEGYGIEPNATMSTYGMNELQLDIYTGSLENYMSDKRFDVISLIQVISHFYDIDKAMGNISLLLNRNGLVLVESWNMRSLIARVLGKYWHAYSPPSVIDWYSDESLPELFKNYNFELIDSGYPTKQISIRHALSILKHNVPNHLFNNRLIDYLDTSLGRFVFNYPPIDLKWYIFRKQLYN